MYKNEGKLSRITISVLSLLMSFGFICGLPSYTFAYTKVSHERHSHSMPDKRPTKQELTDTQTNNSQTNKKETTTNKHKKDTNTDVYHDKTRETEKNNNIFHGISIYKTSEDNNELYEAALLDAKRNAVEQAGTYIEISTTMQNFEITNDDVKILSSAVVKLIPNTIKKQIVSEVDGKKTIKVEADFEINITKLENSLATKRKDSFFNINRTAIGFNFYSSYDIKKMNTEKTDIVIGFSTHYYNNWKKCIYTMMFIAFRENEGEIPLVVSDNHPLKILLYDKNGSITEIIRTPKHASTFSMGSILHFNFELPNPKSVAGWFNYSKVVIKYYQKDGESFEVLIPHRILKQWREMIVSPKELLTNSEI